MIDNLLADPASGLSPALQSFFSGVQDVASNPASHPSRQQMLSQGEALVARFQTFSARLTEMRYGVNRQISDTVNEINYAGRQHRAREPADHAAADRRQPPGQRSARRAHRAAGASSTSWCAPPSWSSPTAASTCSSATARAWCSARRPTRWPRGPRRRIRRTTACSMSRALPAFELQSRKPARRHARRRCSPSAARRWMSRRTSSDAWPRCWRRPSTISIAWAGPQRRAGAGLLRRARCGRGRQPEQRRHRRHRGSQQRRRRADRQRLPPAARGGTWTLTRLSDGTQSTFAAFPQTIDGVTLSLASGAASNGDSFLIQPTRNGARDIAVALTRHREDRGGCTGTQRSRPGQHRQGHDQRRRGHGHHQRRVRRAGRVDARRS